jgi:oxygen-independent coproporphyrinogen-3 oxidase
VLARLQAARDASIKSISVDLIYGLPKQTTEHFEQTLNTIIDFKPERIALYNYAHMPQLIKSQCLIDAKDLPDTNTKIELMAMSIQKLMNEGYIHIGMDHFALPNDSLSVSLREYTLHRNFQGYSTHGDCDLIGFGVSAISHIGDCYSQNTKTLSEYKEAIESDEPALVRGYNLSKDDVIRIDAIQQLMCNRTLNLNDFSDIHAINAQIFFEKELKALEIMATEGLLTIKNQIIIISDDGCLFLRNIAMIFDKYLQVDLNNAATGTSMQLLTTDKLNHLHSLKNISFSKVL